MPNTIADLLTGGKAIPSVDAEAKSPGRLLIRNTRRCGAKETRQG